MESNTTKPDYSLFCRVLCTISGTFEITFQQIRIATAKINQKGNERR
jgi:hypothetical protein